MGPGYEPRRRDSMTCLLYTSEVGPVVVDDMDLEEVGDHAEAEAVPDIPDGAAEDESEGDHGGCQTAAKADDDEDDDRRGNQREDGEDPMREGRTRRVSEHRERCV